MTSTSGAKFTLKPTAAISAASTRPMSYASRSSRVASYAAPSAMLPANAVASTRGRRNTLPPSSSMPIISPSGLSAAGAARMPSISRRVCSMPVRLFENRITPPMPFSRSASRAASGNSVMPVVHAGCPSGHQYRNAIISFWPTFCRVVMRSTIASARDSSVASSSPEHAPSAAATASATGK
ncbi:hypothetical protein DM47_474 [Burkholderia mallei]|nr:hypothetical protein DM47_474 [Burkholderia mallei]